MGEYKVQNLGRESKVEGTIVVQARVDLKCLASLDHYWMENEVRIKTMSQLIGWSLEFCLGMLVSQGIVGKEFKNLGDAHNWMESRGLYQKSMRKRNIRKLVTAMGFEELRANGEQPENYAKNIFDQIHNADRGRNKMEVFPELVDYKPMGSDEEWERGVRMAKEDAERERLEKKEEGRKVLDSLKDDPESIMEVSLEQVEGIINGRNDIDENDPEPKIDNAWKDELKQELDNMARINEKQVEDIEQEIEASPGPEPERVLNKLKMTESEIQAKAKEIELKEINQRKINQQMMSAPKGGIKNEE